MLGVSNVCVDGAERTAFGAQHPISWLCGLLNSRWNVTAACNLRIVRPVMKVFFGDYCALLTIKLTTAGDEEERRRATPG